MTEPITLVSLIYDGPRGYTLAHAEAVAAAVARHASFPYRFVVLTDGEVVRRKHVTVLPLPDAARALIGLHVGQSPDYPGCYPKLWLFSEEASALLGPRILYLDADLIVTGDLAPLVAYEPADPFVWMLEGTKINCSCFRLETGALSVVWEAFLQALPMVRTGACGTSDQGWIRHLGIAQQHACWPRTALGIYAQKDVDALAPYGPVSPLPPGTRLVCPTGKIKPWHQRFLERYPWAKEHYVWTR